MNPVPEISVVMSVHNGARYLRGAVESILGQTGVEFEFLVVNDGSTDESGAILDEYAGRDSRVRVIHQKNTGLTRALIRGCGEARGEFIARQDANDISLPDRLQTQRDYLRAQPDVVVAGSWIELVGPCGEIVDCFRLDADPQVVTEQFLQRGAAPCHSGTMFRRNIYERTGGYRPEFLRTQDHDLWHRMIEHGQIGCPQRVLFQQVLDYSGVSAIHAEQQARLAQLARECAARRRRGEPEEPVLRQVEQLCRNSRQQQPRLSLRRRQAKVDYFIGSRLQHHGRSGARRYLWQSLCKNPWQPKAWVKLLMARQ